MAKSRRKSNGCRRGKLKLKRMGKGYSTMRKQRGSEPPIDRKKKDAEAAAAKAEKVKQQSA